VGDIVDGATHSVEGGQAETRGEDDRITAAEKKKQGGAPGVSRNCAREFQFL
jgi:hypothetical protein